jgi:Integral membrane protein TerC family
MIDLLSDPQAWASLLTLTLLEVVLGIDNVIFLSIVSGRLPKAQQPRARVIGLGARGGNADPATVFHHVDYRPDAAALFGV